MYPSLKAIKRLPKGVHPHWVRESARAVRISSGNLEVAVVGAGDVELARSYYRALVLELESMRVLLWPAE